MIKKIQLIVLLLFLAPSASFATTYYWIGPTGSSNLWNVSTFWSTTSGGVSAGAFPGSGDNAIFDSGGPGNCLLNITLNVNSITILASYPTTSFIDQGPNSITVKDLTLNSGIFLGSNSTTRNITISTGGTVLIAGCNFRSTAAALDFTSSGTNALTYSSGTFNNNGGTISLSKASASQVLDITNTSAPYTPLVFNNFTVNQGTVNFNNISTLTNTLAITGTGTVNFAAACTVNNVTVTGSGTVTFPNSFSVNGTLSITNNAFAARTLLVSSGKTVSVIGTCTLAGTTSNGSININTGTLALQGDLTLSNVSPNGLSDGTLSFTGTANQLISSTSLKGTCLLPNVVISKPGGTLNLGTGIISLLDKNWTYSAGTINPGTSTLYFFTNSSPVTISGTHTLYNVYLQGNGFSISNFFTITNTLTTNDLTIDGATSSGYAEVKVPSNAIVNGTFYWLGGGKLYANGGTVFLNGNMVIGGNAASAAPVGDCIFEFGGTANQAVTNTVLSSTYDILLPTIRLNKPTGKTVTFSIPTTTNTKYAIDGSWAEIGSGTTTFAAGTTSLFVSTSNRSINGSHTVFNKVTLDVTPLGQKVTLTGNLNVRSDLTVNNNTSLDTRSAGIDYNINIGGNFTFVTGNGVFNQNTSLLTFDGASNQNISVSATNIAAFYNVTMNQSPASTLTLLTPISILSATGSLNLTSGVIKSTTSNTLTLNDAATTNIGNASSYIDGPFKYVMAFNGTRILNLPTGNLTASGAALAGWRPAELTVTHAGATADTYTAKLVNSPAKALGYTVPSTIKYVSNIRYWSIDRTANTTFTGTIKLYFGSDDQVNNLSKLRIAKTNGIFGATWADISGGITTGAGSPFIVGSIASSSTPFNATGLFTLATDITTILGDNLLPVVFASFTGDFINDKVNLIWKTASERNNDFFEVERSNGNGIFYAIGQVKSKSTDLSATTTTYNFTDTSPITGSNYYRIKQVDFDHTNSFSATIEVNGIDNLKIYPNPVISDLTITLPEQPESDIWISIKSLMGMEVYNATIPASDYQRSLTVGCNELLSGIYILELTVNGKRLLRKIHKL